MPILVSGGHLLVIDVHMPVAKSLIAEYWGTGVRHFIETGDESRLQDFRGVRIRGHLLETDPDRIEAFYMDTDFDFQEVYEP
jgi:hypothetical protein